MAAWSEMSVGARAGAVVGVAAVVAALLWGAWSVRPKPEEAAAVTEPAAEPAAVEAPAVEAAATEAAAAPEPAAAEAPAAGGETATETATETGAETGAETATDTATGDGAAPAEDAVEAETTPAPEAAAVPVTAPPVFDLVRVERDGAALVAGTGLPAAEISLRIDGAEVIAVPADGAGKFVALFNLAPSAAPRMLGMVMRLADGTEIASEQTVAIAPTLAPEVAVAATGAGTGGQAAASPEPVAPAALLVTEEGAKVLQAPDALPEMAANVTVDSISYTAQGDVQLAGRGFGGSLVRVYLDNRQVGDGVVDAGGNWALTLGGIEPGVYTMRVDQLDGAGKVTSRFETPFKRETLEALAAAAGTEQAAAAAEAAASEGGEATADAGSTAAKPAAAEGPVSVTVQPGFTLWRIAREALGEGVMYVQVFEANKEQIRDPDLIYPGQVFTIPKP